MAFLIGAGKLRLYCGVTTTIASDSKTLEAQSFVCGLA